MSPVASWLLIAALTVPLWLLYRLLARLETPRQWDEPEPQPTHVRLIDRRDDAA